MALTDWPLVILVVEVTGKKTENSQPSLRNRGNVCGIHTSWIMICSQRLVLPQALSTTSRTDACGALSTTSRDDTLTRHEATLAPSTTSRKDIRRVPVYTRNRTLRQQDMCGSDGGTHRQFFARTWRRSGQLWLDQSRRLQSWVQTISLGPGHHWETTRF